MGHFGRRAITSQHGQNPRPVTSAVKTSGLPPFTRANIRDPIFFCPDVLPFLADTLLNAQQTTMDDSYVLPFFR
jgi:hypothetical protein